MNNISSHPSYRVATIASFLLALPAMILYILLVLNIQPNFGPLEPILNNPDPNQPDVVGSLIALGTMLLLLAAFIFNLSIIVRALRAGERITSHPFNLILALAMLGFITSIVGSIVADQYPCWVGVPNCD